MVTPAPSYGRPLIKGKTREQLEAEMWKLPHHKTLLAYFVADVFVGIFASAYGMPLLTLITFLLGFILPSLMWISYAYSLDTIEPEPKYAMKKALYMGMFSVIPVLIVSLLLMAMLGRLGDPERLESGDSLGLLIISISIAPLVEEFLKPIFALRAVRHEIDSELDGAIYGVTAGMGFALVENFLYQLPTVGDPGSWGALTLIRGLTSTLGHALGSGLIGYGYAKYMLHRTPTQPAEDYPPMKFYMLAVMFHWIWNGVLTFTDVYGGILTSFVFLFMAGWPYFEYRILKDYLEEGAQLDRNHWRRQQNIERMVVHESDVDRPPMRYS